MPRVRITMAQRVFDILLVRDEDGVWVVKVPALPGVVTQGRTREEAKRNAREAIELHLGCPDAEEDPVTGVHLDRVRVTAPLTTA